MPHAPCCLVREQIAGARVIVPAAPPLSLSVDQHQCPRRLACTCSHEDGASVTRCRAFTVGSDGMHATSEAPTCMQHAPLCMHRAPLVRFTLSRVWAWPSK